MTKTLILMQGIPGSGKSTMAQMLKVGFDLDRREALIFSTDEYWYRNDPAVYEYNPDEIGSAHRWNQRRVASAMADHTPVVIVDNTNITNTAAHPYKVLAEMFEYEVEVCRVAVPLEVALARNAERTEDRRIPEDVIRKMYTTMENLA